MVVESLFGATSSARAFSRQDLSEKEVEAKFGGAPTWLTYGEFDLDDFFELLRAAAPREGETFVDVGSGCGRLVLAAALVHNWRACVGIEMLGDLHELATKSHTKLVAASADLGLQLAPCELVCDEADSALPRALRGGGDDAAAVVFVYATCWPSVGPHLTALSETLAGALPEGSRVITVDKQLVSDDASGGGGGGFAFDELASFTLKNYNTHQSSAWVYAFRRTGGAAEGGRNLS